MKIKRQRIICEEPKLIEELAYYEDRGWKLDQLVVLRSSGFNPAQLLVLFKKVVEE